MIGSDEGGQEITLTPRNYENAHLNMGQKCCESSILASVFIPQYLWTPTLLNIADVWTSRDGKVWWLRKREYILPSGISSTVWYWCFLGRKKNCLQILMDGAGVRDSMHTFKSSKWSFYGCLVEVTDDRIIATLIGRYVKYFKMVKIFQDKSWRMRKG